MVFEMKKIWDKERLHNIHDVCDYYEGYRDNVGCCDENCENCEERLIEKLEGDDEKMSEGKFIIDLEGIKNEVIENVKEEVTSSISMQLRQEIVKEIYEEVAKPQIEEIREIVEEETIKMVREEIRTFYENEKIKIGGGWNEEPKTYTIKGYVQEKMKDFVDNGKFDADSSRRNSDGVSFEDYLTKRCISGETNRFMEDELKNIQSKVDKQVKEMFNTKIEKMMSEVALGVLKSNATYQEINNKLLGGN